ncbi:predicted protein [Postia placenta Mad-698-R]|uniref:Uncharacterized protein n=1 Tax=Postia placenta MAD-698-R-SB12 TaxID=670580 RepID=A0A1X6N3T3_9APHY|nr:hypothetical protein POSPLADRAFT_1045651 [Postia placenta MAD-698-R-SB12]EED85855.1 predicted protein [Postia placenta Mad-698-R]OSX63274.1 hypothetical protein POSPLADRAFT_1045651 [Postia placenta MAD-698-R-SB12]
MPEALRESGAEHHRVKPKLDVLAGSPASHHSCTSFVSSRCHFQIRRPSHRALLRATSIHSAPLQSRCAYTRVMPRRRPQPTHNMEPALSVASFPTRADIPPSHVTQSPTTGLVPWKVTYIRRTARPVKPPLPTSSSKSGADRMPFPSFSSVVSRRRLFSTSKPTSNQDSDASASSSRSTASTSTSISISQSVSQISEAPSRDAYRSHGLTSRSTFSVRSSPPANQTGKQPAGRPSAHLATGDHGPPPRAERGRSLDLSPYRDMRVEDMDRANSSTESIMIFIHPTPSHSSLSLPFPPLSPTSSVSVDVAPKTAPPPVVAPAAPKKPKKTKRPSTADPHRARSPRRDSIPSYPYFITPMAFSSISPHVAAMPVVYLPAPASPTSDKASSHKQSQSAAASTARPPTAPPESVAPPGAAASPAAPSSPKMSFKRMSSKGRLFRRATVQAPEAPDDGLCRVYDLTTLPVVSPPPAVPAEEPKPLEAAETVTQNPNPNPDSNSAAPPDSDAPTTRPRNAVSVSDDRRVEVAVATLRMRKDVREERGLDQVIPKLRMLRGR